MARNGTEFAELLIYSEIDSSGFFGISARDVVNALNDVSGVKALDIRINSGGGDVFDGIAIFEAIRRFPAEKRVFVDGIAASAASVIAMAADERFISRGGFFMIHKASGLVFGNDDDMRKMAEILSGISDQIADIYAQNTSLDVAMLQDMIAQETWLNAEDSIEHGFATGLIEESGDLPTASMFQERLRNAQQAFRESMKARAERRKPKNSAAPPPDEPPDRTQTVETNPAPKSGAFLMANRKEGQTMSKEQDLRARIEDATLKAEDIKEKADSENRDMTQKELERYNAYLDEADSDEKLLEAEIRLKKRQAALYDSERQPKKPDGSTERPKNGETRVISDRASGMPNGGYKHLGQFANDVRTHFLNGKAPDRLYRNQETSFGSGGVGEDGGFAIPEDFRDQIFNNIMEQDPLVQRARQINTEKRSVRLSTRETQPWETGSITSGWVNEGESITRSKQKLSKVTIELNKNAALINATEELLEDAPLLEQEIVTEASEQIGYDVAHAIVRGSGVEQPLGFLESPALVTIAAETAGGGQTADTIVVENFNKMYAAMPPRNLGNAIWIAHPSAQEQIWKAAFHAPSGADPIGRMPGTIPDSPFGSIYGRPLIIHQAASSIGDVGDLMFVDLSDYALPIKQGGLRTDTSIHLAFDQDMRTFRVIMRVGGAPLWKQAITSRVGNFKQSPFVTLAAR